MNISLGNTFYWRILLDNVGISIHDYFLNKDNFQGSYQAKTTFQSGQNYISYSYFLRTREGYMPTITKSRLIATGEIPFKHAWARLLSTEIDQDSAIIDLAYLFTGLITITQSHLVHHILQGVEHTDPMEWSNSHRSIGDKSVRAVWQTASLFKGCSLVSFQWWFSHSYGDGSATFILFKGTESITKWLSTVYTYNVLFSEQLDHVPVIFQHY